MNIKENYINTSNIPDKLDKQEFYKLIIKHKNKDPKAREELILHNIKLVLYRITTKFKSTNYDKNDLVQVGLIGLINAIDTYDETKNIEFSTYAVRCIDYIIYKYIRDNNKYQNLYNLDEITIKQKDINNPIEENYIDQETKLILLNIINNLEPKEKEIIKMYYGFYNKKFSQQEIAKYLKTKQPKISKIINKTIKEIRNQMDTTPPIKTKIKTH